MGSARGADVLRGDGEPNSPDGWGGDELLFGRRGDDRLSAGNGDDKAYGQAASDYCDLWTERHVGCE